MSALLRWALQCYCSAGVSSDWDGLRTFLRAVPEREAAFKAELADAIVHHRLSPAALEEATSVDHDDQASADRFLLEELWQPLYGDEPPAA